MNKIKIILISLVVIVAVAVSGKCYIDYTVKKTINNNPDLIVMAVQKWQKKQEDIQSGIMVSQFYKYIKDVDLPTIGATNGEVTLYEFMDYQCGYCKKFSYEVKKLIKLDKTVTVKFIDYPIFGEFSELAAKVALASRRQGLYNNVHTAFMQNKFSLNKKLIFLIAQQQGVDMIKLKKDIKDKSIINRIVKNKKLGEAVGANVAPFNIIVDMDGKGQSISGYLQLEKLTEVINKYKVKQYK